MARYSWCRQVYEAWEPISNLVLTLGMVVTWMYRWASEQPVEGVGTVLAHGHASSHGPDLPTSWASTAGFGERQPFAGLTR